MVHRDAPLTETGRLRLARWTMRAKTALNAFDITFDGRLFAARPTPSATPVEPFF
ncbi:hypothetical protein LRE75_08210 [Streptomyces sp. 372A]|uniref:hypothetical protein n=1 Tax=Streptomyces sp. SAS_281 TaxID=3412744 RepID=UPI00403D54BC